MYESVICWVKHDLTEREPHFPTLLGLVKLHQLSPEYLKNTVQQEVQLYISSHSSSFSFSGFDLMRFYIYKALGQRIESMFGNAGQRTVRTDHESCKSHNTGLTYQ